MISDTPKSRLERLLLGKVEVWVVLLLMIFAGVGTLLFGWIVKSAAERPNDTGRIGRFAVEIATVPDYARTLLRSGLELDAAGDLVQKNPQAIEFDAFKGLKVEDPSFEESGLLLVSAYSDEHRISTVYLFDLATRERLWEWVPNYDQIVETTPSIKRIAGGGGRLPPTRDRASFRAQHPWLLDDGSLLITSGEGPLVRLDVHGNVMWTSDRHYHHSIQRMADGNFIIPIKIKEPDDDAYAIVSPDGRLLEERSIVGILERNGYQGLLYGVGRWESDRTHLNDAEPILATDEYVREGDIVLSSRHLSTVFLYRPSEDRVVWLQTGPWANQHDVDYIGHGRFTIFGNDFVRGRDWEIFGTSNIYGYDMTTRTATRPYEDIFWREQLRTPTQGLLRLLDNGDVFVSLTDEHQLLRVGRDGIRWRYVSPLKEGGIGALHWSRYYNRDELDLAWLDGLRTKGDHVDPQ